MPSRQDLLHSHQYSLQRVVAALVTHDPDPGRSPLRRVGTTALISVVIAALAVGAVAIYGLITGHSAANLRDESVVFMEKGSGARFVYLREDDRLHPVLNYSSGLLIANAEKPRLVSVSRERLATMPLGEPLGIPGAPDSLPQPKQLRSADWTVCTALDQDGETRSTVLVGVPITDGRTPPGVLIRDPAGQVQLLNGGKRFPVQRATASLRALGWNAQQPWPVAAAFVNAVPFGADLEAPAIVGQGRESIIPGVRVGQLLTDGGQWSVALRDGAAAVTDVQARLLQALRGAAAPKVLTSSAFNNLPPSLERLHRDDLPAAVPQLMTPTARLCLGRELRADPTVPAGVTVRGEPGAPGAVRADFVYVARGAGALVVAAASPRAPADSGTVSVVTDTGRRYAVAARELLPRLGYASSRPHSVPAQLVALVPQGPALDAERARQVE